MGMQLQETANNARQKGFMPRHPTSMRRRILLAGIVGCLATGVLWVGFVVKFGGFGHGLAAIGRHLALPGLLQGDPRAVLLVYGRQDTVVSPWMAERLASAATAPVAMLPVSSDHNSLWKSVRFGLNGSVRDWIHAR
jgi:hypothetical protein